MQSTTTTIAPEQAVEMMAKSKQAGGLNRLTKSKVAKLVRQLTAHRWVLNGKPIIVSVTGKILDGHHRLEACRIANVAFETLLERRAES